MSLRVVGALHPNGDGSNRLFEIALCSPGEPVQLVPEPRNPADPQALAVLSARGLQIGYLSAERCGWIGSRIRLGEPLVAVFQAVVPGGALIRVGFAGEAPALPAVHAVAPAPVADDSGFYPDFLPPDD